MRSQRGQRGYLDLTAYPRQGAGILPSPHTPQLFKKGLFAVEVHILQQLQANGVTVPEDVAQ